jgi:hypothetical protein
VRRGIHRGSLDGVFAGSALMFAAACAPAGPARPPRPEPAGVSVAERPSAERWIVRATSEPRTHEVRLEGTLTSRIDTLERTDTLRAEVRTTWTFAAAPPAAPNVPARISGTITAFRVAFAGSDSLHRPDGLALPVLYAADWAAPGEQPQLTLPRAEECGAGAAALATLRELWISPPDTLAVGREWADSARYLTCRDSIPIAVTSLRAFRVLGAEERDGATFVRIARRSTTHMTGSGTQFGEPLEIEAEGVGEAVLELALAGGAIRSGAGESELRMQMRSRRRTQELVQRTRLTIVVP